ncbi:hypothetical protein CDL15_Pgr006621 [Punica granatum]|uniref:Uncharacterized protein n=1 Tax=Punica granatum TaxID=22663 RepID=A0A218X7V6_PUNGR|nr:hypothetical protein CDL15_Pgr006621 [Punica granatum]
MMHRLLLRMDILVISHLNLNFNQHSPYKLTITPHIPFAIDDLIEQKKRRSAEQRSADQCRGEDEGTGLVVDAGGLTPIGLRLVRLLRHLGPSPCRLLHHHQSVISPYTSPSQLNLLLYF